MTLATLLTAPGFAIAFREVDRTEAEEGICAEPGECFVAEEDREPPTAVGIFDGVPNPINPRDPYGCENPVSQEDGS